EERVDEVDVEAVGEDEIAGRSRTGLRGAQARDENAMAHDPRTADNHAAAPTCAVGRSILRTRSTAKPAAPASTSGSTVVVTPGAAGDSRSARSSRAASGSRRAAPPPNPVPAHS